MSKYEGPLIDVDVHTRPRCNDDMRGYLSEQWRDYLAPDGRAGVQLKPPQFTVGAAFDSGSRREDTFPEQGPAGSDYPLLKEQLLDLDQYDLRYALLTHDLGEFATHPNQYFAREVCRAMNEWMIDYWLSQDDRLNAVVLAPTAVPEEAAEDLRRFAENPRMVGVLMSGNPLGRPLGDPLYHPVYAAAEEFGLTICVHPGGGDRPNQTIASAGGPKGTGTEFVTQFTQQAMHYVTSLVVHGVFEKFPSLKFVINEYGFTWLPSLMWRLDNMYAMLRRESPWVRDLPSNYIREHIKFSTQPIAAGEKSGSLAQLLETVDGMDRLLCYSSDYPHISMDDAGYVARVLPRAWHSRVFYENALESYPKLEQRVMAAA